MEKELAQSDLPIQRKIPKTTRKHCFSEKSDILIIDIIMNWIIENICCCLSVQESVHFFTYFSKLEISGMNVHFGDVKFEGWLYEKMLKGPNIDIINQDF